MHTLCLLKIEVSVLPITNPLNNQHTEDDDMSCKEKKILFKYEQIDSYSPLGEKSLKIL